MKRCVLENSNNSQYNASSKAREDAMRIVLKCGYEKFGIETVYGVRTEKIKKALQVFTYIKNRKIWEKKIKKFLKGDVVFIQYPLNNTVLGFDKTIKEMREKGVKTIALIHDIDSLRYRVDNGFFHYYRKKFEDKNIIREFDVVIAHNDIMKNKLVDMDISSEKIISLQIFDYLMENEPILNNGRNKGVIIAGNLDDTKAGYLKELKNIKGVRFNLYGKGLNEDILSGNISYKGAYLPEELIEKFEGNYGLVWDGKSAETCEGGFGEYMKYNNPHKASLYIAAEIPLIVWKKSALAEWVLKNNIGITVDSLHDLGDKIRSISNAEYEQMKRQLKSISNKVCGGYYLSEAMKKAEAII